MDQDTARKLLTENQHLRAFVLRVAEHAPAPGEAVGTAAMALGHDAKVLLAAVDTPPSCPDCQDSGMRDSGGVQPWGEAIFVPCDCKAAVTAAQCWACPDCHIPEGCVIGQCTIGCKPPAKEAAATAAQPEPLVMQYLALTDAMHYTPGEQLLSAEEYAAALHADATRYRWLRDQAGSVFSTTPDGWRLAVVAHAPGHGVIPRTDNRELDTAIDAAAKVGPAAGATGASNV